MELEKKEPIKTKFVELKTKSFESENQYIILALESENQKLYFDARNLYFKLFEKTDNYEYFVKYKHHLLITLYISCLYDYS